MRLPMTCRLRGWLLCLLHGFWSLPGSATPFCRQFLQRGRILHVALGVLHRYVLPLDAAQKVRKEEFHQALGLQEPHRRVEDLSSRRQSQSMLVVVVQLRRGIYFFLDQLLPLNQLLPDLRAHALFCFRSVLRTCSGGLGILRGRGSGVALPGRGCGRRRGRPARPIR